MPRTARAIEAGMIYHVLNRGNGRMRLFHKAEDYDAFERVVAEGLGRFPVALLTYCLMPNHWHLVMRPRTEESLGRLMGWVGVTHVRRHHEHYHKRGAGHLYQGRYKSFPVAADDYFLTLCRYVEANPVRAKLVERADQWRWSGFSRRAHRKADLPLSPWPIERPRNWTILVNGELSAEELKTVRTCVSRGRPLGPEAWVEATASRLGLAYTLRGPGRPRKDLINQ
jgi:putative transposase